MFSLFILLLERVGLIIIVAYLLMNVPYFKKMMSERSNLSSQIQLLIVFGLFAAVSNFTGVEIRNNEILSSQIFSKISDDAVIANTRVLTISVAGLIGGPVVGIGVGIVSGITRYLIGGVDAYTYVISSALIGLTSGYFGYRAMTNNRYPNVLTGVILGAIMEVIQMICIIVFATNTEYALDIVKLIALPMIMINSLGVAIFLSIIISTIQQEQRMRAVQTHDVLNLANQTLPYFRAGLNEASATQAAQIIKDLMKVSAVSITNKTDILAHVGAASDHHVPRKKIITDLSKQVIKSGEIKEAHNRHEIGCTHPGCPLEGAIVIPLYVHNEVTGTLKLYFTDSNKLTYVERRLAEGLANIFSSQIELGEIETQSKLLKDAEIKSLQAQVNPHFFFNAMNTISALIRVDSERARELLLNLSNFFRSNLQGAKSTSITIEKEIQQVEAYLALEQARFPERFNIHFDIDEALKYAKVPPFIIQILVENAIKHAFHNRKSNNDVYVKVKEGQQTIEISVEDNGFGIPKEKRAHIGHNEVSSTSGTGSALENLNKRLIGLYNSNAQLNFTTSDSGTKFYTSIPLEREEDA
ncbi:sensor histidine kinase [Macrococcoides caseolyticum]|uniref:sensor histidine kinase n=1 Tax=Macrococcoides caseolyticum TaxID=69966 RepID=UPI000C348E4C|nr:sensor histidine kinase [Macrococcus caseolyticus]PKE11960.1 sensor histidine kinase [Macrococcus caseolyticus]PKE49297.1 sensor histidine kinase [Macrococcus caseolyticus]PKF16390.1 sensor histidine kinase [Macrococcus caseolyticus]QQB04976.1 sensor histidine kinase [Macrococcus caseolyticus]TDM26530.1 sensor histidine kinase [Macrococcus caseolyticus]